MAAGRDRDPDDLDYPDLANPDRWRDAAVSSGMEAYLRSQAEGASEEAAFAVALGKATERYLDSLDPAECLRLLVGLHPAGVTIPEERVLPEDTQGRRLVLEAAKRMNEVGEIRRVLSTTDGRVYWLPQGGDVPASPGGNPDR